MTEAIKALEDGCHFLADEFKDPKDLQLKQRQNEKAELQRLLKEKVRGFAINIELLLSSKLKYTLSFNSCHHFKGGTFFWLH